MDIEELELHLLVEAIHKQYGYDFRNYARASLKRRILQRMQVEEIPHILEMTHQLLQDRGLLEKVLQDLSIQVTAMFRDPSFYRKLREEVIPYLRSYPSLRIWIAGCSSGEEPYSLAILLEEEDLYGRSRIYATDFNPKVLEVAEKGIYPMSQIQEYTKNYQEAGGKAAFSDYYTARYESVLLDPRLKNHLVFSSHNLVSDQVFNEMHLITCRNVLIYFNPTLQNRVVGLFHDSLIEEGFLGLGNKESLHGLEWQNTFETINAKEKIFRKKRVW